MGAPPTASTRTATARRRGGQSWQCYAAAVAATWLLLGIGRTVAFMLIRGTGWRHALFPWEGKLGLLLEGALAVLPVAAVLAAGGALALRRGRWATLSRCLGVVIMFAALAFYVASWATFDSVGEFLDVSAWRFWFANPSQNLAYASDMEPRLLAVVPLVVLTGFVGALAVCAWSARATRWHRRIVLRGASSVAIGAVVAVAPLVQRTRQDHEQRLDLATGTNWDADGMYSMLRRDGTDPVLHLAAATLNTIRGEEIARPSPRFTITYPPVAGSEPGTPRGAAARRHWNVIVILMESVRADQLRAYGATRDVMPHVDSLARQSRVFARTYAVATHTNYASPAVLSSQYPMRSTTYFLYPKELPFAHHFIYERLERAGYRTAFFSSDDEHWGGKLNYIDTTSFDRFFHAESFVGPRYRPNGAIEGPWLKLRNAGLLDDDVTVSVALDWLDHNANAPFFLYLSLQNSHSPYYYPENFRAPFGSDAKTGDRPRVRFAGITRESLPAARDAYANSLAYDDTQLERLFADLRARGLWDSTIIVLTADHGEAFDEHGFAIHANALYDELLRIPLVIRAPGLVPGVDSTIASTIDVPPTILGLLGMPPDPAFQGADLTVPQRDPVAYSVVQTTLADQYAMIHGDWKLIYDRPRRRYLLFDLATDPHEENDVASRLPARRDAMAERLNTWRWAQLHYYDTAVLRARFYAPRVTPCATCAPSPEE